MLRKSKKTIEKTILSDNLVNIDIREEREGESYSTFADLASNTNYNEEISEEDQLNKEFEKKVSLNKKRKLYSDSDSDENELDGWDN